MPGGAEKFSNNFDDIDKIEKADDGDDWKVEYSNKGYVSEKPPLASTSSGSPSYHSEPSDQPPPYEESAIVSTSEKGKGIEVVEDDEEKILNVLREIVRKCTLANPMKRPTAREVLKMIEEVAPPELLSEKFNISDDEDDDDDGGMQKKLK